MTTTFTFHAHSYASLVQGFFSYRIYAFTKRLYIPILSWSMSFVRFLGTMAIFVTALHMTAISGYEEQWGWLLTIVWCVSVANDLTIAAALVANLISHRSHIHKRTVVLVDKLVVWTIGKSSKTSYICSQSMYRDWNADKVGFASHSLRTLF
ncbi:hypothetical protein B0H14DRAFT_2361127 [Mycena olivaceomarginata]|nr:hypothetical protein B0H14DRAFT_2361127 [Mycena olivaceomarginata]